MAVTLLLSAVSYASDGFHPPTKGKGQTESSVSVSPDFNSISTISDFNQLTTNFYAVKTVEVNLFAATVSTDNITGYICSIAESNKNKSIPETSIYLFASDLPGNCNVPVRSSTTIKYLIRDKHGSSAWCPNWGYLRQHSLSDIS